MSNAEHLQHLGSQETTYEQDNPLAEHLEVFEYENQGDYQMVGFKTDEFTSLCPKTGQPDFANIDIAYVPRKLGVESKSLKLYLFRYRNHGSFHEDVIAKIARDIQERVEPYYIRVIGDFTRRGGIAIKPMSELIADDANEDKVAHLIMQYDNYDWQR